MRLRCSSRPCRSSAMISVLLPPRSIPIRSGAGMISGAEADRSALRAGAVECAALQALRHAVFGLTGTQVANHVLAFELAIARRRLVGAFALAPDEAFQTIARARRLIRRADAT